MNVISNSYQKEYMNKLVTADEAVKLVKSGDWVDYGDFVTSSVECDKALAKRKNELRGVKVRGCTNTLNPLPEVISCDPEAEHFFFHDWSFSAITRKMGDEGRAFFQPECYHEIPRMYREGRTKCDVAFFTVTPMDKFGNFNLSTSCSKLLAEKEAAKKIVVEINTNLPYCYSAANNNIHISEVDFVVEGKNPPIFETTKPPVTDVDRKIAALIMKEMEDGACLQLGIGGMPNTVGEMIAQSDLKNLGVHTEMLVDSYVDMFEAGRITNSAKNVLKDKFVYTFAMGSKKLYDFVDNNPLCCAMPVDFTNDPFIIAQNDKVVSLCSCLSVDILGQVSSESIGFRHISGTGGQLDFHYASFRSKGGKGFLCMPATSKKKDGTLESKIVPSFKPGTIVSVPSALTNYVVTEFGIVNLKGLSTWERAEALISIAHPSFQDELVKIAEENRIWIPSNKIRI